MTVYAILAAFGAFLALSAAVFLPGVGILILLGAGGELNINCVLSDIFDLFLPALLGGSCCMAGHFSCTSSSMITFTIDVIDANYRSLLPSMN